MIRKAKIEDIKQIHSLINFFAEEDLMLPRSLNELYDNIRDFWVYEEDNKVLGCAALHISWDDLAEIKSLAVKKDWQERGIGKQLISACIKEAKELGAKRAFVLTYHFKYFSKLGFKRVKHDTLPHKIWAECINCPKFPNCQEIALIKNIAK
jgi:amino-acid N-acetyltransferase